MINFADKKIKAFREYAKTAGTFKEMKQYTKSANRWQFFKAEVINKQNDEMSKESL